MAAKDRGATCGSRARTGDCLRGVAPAAPRRSGFRRGREWREGFIRRLSRRAWVTVACLDRAEPEQVCKAVHRRLPFVPSRLGLGVRPIVGEGERPAIGRVPYRRERPYLKVEGWRPGRPRLEQLG